MPRSSLTLISWSSPLGPLWLALSERGVAGLYFREPPQDLPPAEHRELKEGQWPWLASLQQQLAAYFAGKPVSFADIPLELRGTTFQIAVWKALRQLPFGHICTYGELAGYLGRPRAARAVGQALGANPIPLIIPCHRVVAANGSLGGYSSPLEIKNWLLTHEATHSGLPAFSKPIVSREKALR